MILWEQMYGIAGLGKPRASGDDPVKRADGGARHA